MSIAKRYTYQASGDGTSHTIAIDDAPIAGRLLFSAIASDKDAGTVTPPAGWSTPTVIKAGTNVTLAYSTKVAEGDETEAAWGISRNEQVAGFVYELGDDVSGIDVVAANNSGNSGVSSLSTGTTAETANDDSFALALWAVDTNNYWDDGRSKSDGFIEQDFLPAGCGLMSASKSLSTAGTVECTASWNDGADQVAAAMVVFTVVPVPPRLADDTAATLAINSSEVGTYSAPGAGVEYALADVNNDAALIVNFDYRSADAFDAADHADTNVLVVQSYNQDAASYAALKAQRTKPICYVNVGEVADAATYRSDYDDSWILGRNPNWASSVVDMRNADCRNYVLNSLMSPQIIAGAEGVFLDTMDSFNLVLTDDAEKQAYRNGMSQLIADFKAAHPAAQVYMNRGFDVFDTVKDQIDVVVFESWFVGYNGQQYTVIPQGDRDWLVGQLTPIRNHGTPVICIDYVQDPAAEFQAALRVANAGFVPVVSSGNLDRVGQTALISNNNSQKLTFAQRNSYASRYAISNSGLVTLNDGAARSSNSIAVVAANDQGFDTQVIDITAAQPPLSIVNGPDGTVNPGDAVAIQITGEATSVSTAAGDLTIISQDNGVLMFLAPDPAAFGDKSLTFNAAIDCTLSDGSNSDQFELVIEVPDNELFGRIESISDVGFYAGATLDVGDYAHIKEITGDGAILVASGDVIPTTALSFDVALYDGAWSDYARISYADPAGTPPAQSAAFGMVVGSSDVQAIIPFTESPYRLALNGTDQSVALPAWVPSGVHFGISLALSFEDLVAGAVVLADDDPSSQRFRISSQNRLQFTYVGNTGELQYLVYPEVLTPDTNYDVSVLSDSSGVSLTVNGQRVSSATVADPSEIEVVRLAANKWGNGQFTAMSASRLQLIDYGEPANSRYYPITDGAGGVARDILGNGSTNGTIANFTDDVWRDTRPPPAQSAAFGRVDASATVLPMVPSRVDPTQGGFGRVDVSAEVLPWSALVGAPPLSSLASPLAGNLEILPKPANNLGVFVLFENNTHLVRIEGLRRLLDDAVVVDANIEFNVLLDGTALPGVAWPLTMRALGAGAYVGTLPVLTGLRVDAQVELVVRANAQGSMAEWQQTLNVVDRAFGQ